MRYDNIGYHIVKTNPSRCSHCKLFSNQTICICQKYKVHMHQKCSVEYHHVGQSNPVKIYPSCILIRIFTENLNFFMNRCILFFLCFIEKAIPGFLKESIFSFNPFPTHCLVKNVSFSDYFYFILVLYSIFHADYENSL